MRSSGPGNLAVWAWLESMNEVGEENGIIDEEDRYVDPYDILCV